MAYAERAGARTGARVWRATSDGARTVVLPDAAMDVMWFDGQLVVAGPDTAAVVFDMSPGQVTWGVRLAPGLAHALLGVSVHELANLRVPLVDIIGRQGTRRDCGADIGDGLEGVLLGLCDRARPDRAVLASARAIDRAARAGLGAREAAGSLGLPDRTLHRHCLRWFGYGYKTLSTIHRLQRALRLAAAGASLSDASARAGYADQSHFARECRRLAGATPSALIRRV